MSRYHQSVIYQLNITNNLWLFFIFKASDPTVFRSKSGKFLKLILLLKMNLEGFGYNLQQTESKLAHYNRNYSMSKVRNVITLGL